MKLKEGQLVIHDEKIKFIKKVKKSHGTTTVEFDDGSCTSDVKQISIPGK